MSFLVDIIRGWLGASGTSWIELDKQMRARLKANGIIIILILALGIVVISYFFDMMPGLQKLINDLVNAGKASINRNDELPKWWTTAGTVAFAFAGALTLLLLAMLVDGLKTHYWLDFWTVRTIRAVASEIVDSFHKGLGCPEDSRSDCKLAALVKDDRRRFNLEIFYQLANKDLVGAFNQKEKRQNVFIKWTQYYTANFVFLSFAALLSWFILLCLVKHGSPLLLGTLGAAGLCLALLWQAVGRSYKKELILLAREQVEAFFRYARSESVSTVAGSVGVCNAKRCPLQAMNNVVR